MTPRTPRFVRWSLSAVAAVLPIALIAPWEAQAVPAPAATAASDAAISAAPVSQLAGQVLAPADGDDEPDQGRDRGERRGENNERRRKDQAAPDDGGGGKGKQVNANCTLIVPEAPLTAQGLGTPYQLVATNRRNGPCREANVDQSAFVEATILDPATGALSIYRPLVTDRGKVPAAPPIVPKLPPGAVVGVWFGFQGDVLTLRGATEGCVNGLPRSPFGQFAYCGAPEFFTAANNAIRAGKLKIPPVGTARDGKPCPTTRDFSVVDQDQSDNLDTSYLALADGRTAQNNQANAVALPATAILRNGSDNGLLNGFIAPALGCKSFTAQDITAGGLRVPSLALNELQAAAAQAEPVALIPPNNPMAQVNGRRSVAKANLYRAGVNMLPLDPAVDTARAYCTNLATVGAARLRLGRLFTIVAPSPDPAAARNLFTFLQQRLKGSFADLACGQARRRR